jgi:transposase, IS5 family
VLILNGAMDMRMTQNPRLQFGQVNISQICLDLKSRDDIPQILKGLQYIYITRSVREQIFELLEKHIAAQVDKKNGRPGMELWKILVLGVLRLDLNCDYDRSGRHYFCGGSQN